jgi:hypothetical protein
MLITIISQEKSRDTPNGRAKLFQLSETDSISARMDQWMRDAAVPGPERGPQLNPNTGRKPRKLFTADEDARLTALVDQLGADSWSTIAGRLPGRSPRQCKDRYCTYLCPTVRKAPWTEAEDDLLFQKVREHGQRWSDISKFFNGRTANSVKNRWHLHLRGSRGKSPILPEPVMTAFQPVSFTNRPQYSFFPPTPNSVVAFGGQSDRPQLPPAVSLPFAPAQGFVKQ